jgi:hypothetical protein
MMAQRDFIHVVFSVGSLKFFLGLLELPYAMDTISGNFAEKNKSSIPRKQQVISCLLLSIVRQ